VRVDPVVWRLARLKFVAPLRNERMSAGSDHPGYIGLENIESWTGKIIEVESKLDDETAYESAGLANMFRDGDVLFGKLRPYLAKACLAPHDGVCSTELLVMRPSELLEPRFLLYSILTPNFVGAVDASTFGAKMPRANWDSIGSLEVKVPTVEKQRLIANYLDRETARIDGLIAEKERMLALLEEKRTALISRAVTRGLDLNAPLKPSGLEWLGEIPAHWQMWRLKHLTSEALSYGANEAALEDNPEWPRFVRITDIATDGSLREETFKSLSPEIAKPFLLEEGDLLFARSGATVGKSFIYKKSWGAACFAGYLIRFRCDLEKVLPDYLNLYARSSAYWHQVSTGLIQATIENFSAEKYADIEVPLPPKNVQQEIVNVMSIEQSRFADLSSNIRKSLTLMKERRAAMIAAAVTGHIPLEEMAG
jgi:type I restriction enzyme S subunit